MTEWKPGDVAMATNPAGLEFMVVRTGLGNTAYWSAPMDWPKGVSNYGCTYRPLVVIDPEDREAVERLLRGYAGRTSTDDGIENYPRYVSDMQAALREFANPTPPTPPKPDEPLGLGAVVATEAGERWVRFTAKTGSWWRNHQGQNLRYADLDVARVLSEGVPA